MLLSVLTDMSGPLELTPRSTTEPESSTTTKSVKLGLLLKIISALVVNVKLLLLKSLAVAETSLSLVLTKRSSEEVALQMTLLLDMVGKPFQDSMLKVCGLK